MPARALFQGSSWRWFLFLGWGASILVMSLIPTPPRICNSLLGWDKLQHAIAYGIFTLFGYLALAGVDDCRRRVVFSMIIAVGFGVLMELCQGALTAGRLADYRDVIANSFGILLAWCAITVYNRRAKR